MTKNKAAVALGRKGGKAGKGRPKNRSAEANAAAAGRLKLYWIERRKKEKSHD